MIPEYFERLSSLLETGTAVVSVTLVDITGSAPQEQGARMLVTEGGIAYGTVGGGKVEARALEEARRLLKSGPAHFFVEWNLQTDIGMTCGGVVRLYFESFTAERWRIALFGAGHVSQALVPLLLTLDCEIVVIDPRQEWLDRLPKAPRLRRVTTDSMADVIGTLDAGTFVVLLTMGHATDSPILAKGLLRDFPFLGVIGSPTKRLRLVKDMREAGIPADRQEKFFCPVGLRIGRSRPAEIAISIAAQLLEVRDAVSATSQPETQSRSQTHDHSQKSQEAASQNSAR